MSRAFHHVGLTVNDMATSIAFYELLGFEKLEPQYLEITDQEWLPRIITLSPGNMIVSFMGLGPLTLELLQYVDPKGAGRTALEINDAGSSHIGLEVSDCRTEYERLLAVGVEFRNPPVTIPDDPVFGGVVVVYGFDPDGNTFEMQTFPTTNLEEAA